MIDLKTYTTIELNESFWRKITPIALELLCFLVIYFSPQMKRSLTIAGVKTVDAIVDFIKKKFPKVYAKIISNKQIATFLDQYPDIIEEFIAFTSNTLTTKAINIFSKRILTKIPKENIEQIKSLLE